MGNAITWDALGSVIATAATLLGGLWAVYGAIKRQFDKAAELGEDRARRTHQRIDNLREDIHETYLPREVHAADMRRLSDALEERDRLHADLAARLNCPAMREDR